MKIRIHKESSTIVLLFPSKGIVLSSKLKDYPHILKLLNWSIINNFFDKWLEI